MRDNQVRQKLLNGESVIGLQVGLASPHVTELLAHSGFDWLALEMEHTSIDSRDLEYMMMAMNGTETIPLVRPSVDVPHDIQKALDAGAMGVFAPMIKTAADAEAIVKATRYPPEGTRGCGPLRASRYTLDYDDYLARANEHMLVTFILETKEALENLEEIMSVPGVDALYFGPFDLCYSMGLNPLNLPMPEIEEEIDRAVELSKKTGVAVGIGAGTPEELNRRLDQGMRFMSYGTDCAQLHSAVKVGVDTFRGRESR